MKLPIVGLEYMSPTSFMHAKDCLFSYWLMRFSPIAQREPQTRPMAIGSAVDSFLKAELARQLGETKPESLLAELLKNVDFPDLIAVGKKLADEYIEAGMLTRLLDSGLDHIELDYVNREIMGIPIRAKPDAKLKDGTPVDWKVNGFESKWGGRIQKGVTYQVRNRMSKLASLDPCTLEQSDLKWGIQMLIYYHVINGHINSPRGRIEQICIDPKGVTFATYDLPIDPMFANDLLAEMKSVWMKLTNGEIDEPVPDVEKCHPYKRPRLCTGFCPAYKTYMENPVNALFME